MGTKRRGPAPKPDAITIIRRLRAVAAEAHKLANALEELTQPPPGDDEIEADEVYIGADGQVIAYRNGDEWVQLRS